MLRHDSRWGRRRREALLPTVKNGISQRRRASYNLTFILGPRASRKTLDVDVPKQVTGVGLGGTLESENGVVVALASVKLETTVRGAKECTTDQTVLIKEDGPRRRNGQSREEAETASKHHGGG